MKRSSLFFIYLLVNVAISYAADPEKYDWEADRKKYTVTEEERSGPAIVLKDKRVVEYIFDEANNLLIHKTQHKIILVNTSEAIDQFNKVYVQIEDPNSLISIKARSINKNGKVTLLDRASFKELQNMENMGAFKIFAIEGLEAGSEIEYIYTVKRSMSLFGREYFQNSFPVKNINFDIISPSHLEFEARSYNGLPAFKDTVISGKRFLSLSAAQVPAALKEEYATYEANLQRVDYKLAYNNDNGLRNVRGRLLTWENAAERIFNQTGVFTTAEISKVKKLCKTQKFYSLKDENAKIQAVENFIKSNFLIREGSSEDYVLLDKIISNKYADQVGIVRLFEAIYSELGIEHRLVLTSDRSDSKFDGEFDTWKFLDHYIFYFPSSDKYLAPTEMEMRYGMIPFYWTHNEGLFIKKISEGKKVIAQGDIKFIPALTSDKSMDNIYADIAFMEDMENVTVKATRKIGGYNAVHFQPFYNLIDEEKKTQLNEELMKFISPDAEISNIKVENIDPNKSLVDNPFVISGDIKISSLIERAGSKYFFKVGDVIGRQAELYSDKKRVSPIENDFNRIYLRQIKVRIPEGYVFKNLDDINKNVAYEDKGEKTMGFISTYKVEGNLLTIDINEYYNRINFPLAMYEDFRKVINAAADFNKVVLIVEKAK